MTTARLGCYQPTEHIDNPKGYGDGEDASKYDPRLRGPVDERRELAIDEKTGMSDSRVEPFTTITIVIFSPVIFKRS